MISSLLLSSVVEEENESFLKLVHLYGELNETVRDSAVNNRLIWYLRVGRDEEKEAKREVQEKKKEPIWGKRTLLTRSNLSNYSNAGEVEPLSYGLVVGFNVSELDPENSLSRFLNHAPLSL
ncbi:hypothetical protein Ancab_021244 [Ancistrocladus abbreviatus]